LWAEALILLRATKILRENSLAFILLSDTEQVVLEKYGDLEAEKCMDDSTWA